MIDADDVSVAGAVGGLFVLAVFVVWHLTFSVPEIEQCHKAGGVIVRIEGTDRCVEPPVEIKK